MQALAVRDKLKYDADRLNEVVDTVKAQLLVRAQGEPLNLYQELLALHPAGILIFLLLPLVQLH